jgi:hypothetical protein
MSDRIADWPAFRAFALALAQDEALSGIEETTSWGHPVLKAHGKMWAWWSPSEDAPVFKADHAERDFLCEVDPDTFFVTAHYRPHRLILVRPARLDPAWAHARLLAS